MFSSNCGEFSSSHTNVRSRNAKRKKGLGGRKRFFADGVFASVLRGLKNFAVQGWPSLLALLMFVQMYAHYNYCVSLRLHVTDTWLA